MYKRSRLQLQGQGYEIIVPYESILLQEIQMNNKKAFSVPVLKSWALGKLGQIKKICLFFCNKAENYWVGLDSFFSFRIVMHHNASKCKINCYISNVDIFTLQDSFRHVMKLSIGFEVNSYE